MTVLVSVSDTSAVSYADDFESQDEEVNMRPMEYGMCLLMRR